MQEEVLSSLSPFPTRSRASPTFFYKRLNSSLSQSIIIDLQVCEDVPTKACNTVNEQVWENRFWFRLKFQHILLATLVLILKLTWLWFHKTVTQDLSYAKNFTGLRDCLRRCLSSKLQFKSLTRKSLLLRFKDSKSLMFWSKLPIFRLPDQRTGDQATEHQPPSARGFPSRSAEMSHGRSATMFLRK